MSKTYRVNLNIWDDDGVVTAIGSRCHTWAEVERDVLMALTLGLQHLSEEERSARPVAAHRGEDVGSGSSVGGGATPVPLQIRTLPT